MATCKNVGLRLTAIAFACVLALPGLALADPAREAQLEQRVSELERQLADLIAEIKTQRTAAPVAAAPAVPAGKLPIQAVSLTPGSPAGTTLRYGGFIKADFMATKAHDGQLADARACCDGRWNGIELRHTNLRHAMVDASHE